MAAHAAAVSLLLVRTTVHVVAWLGEVSHKTTARDEVDADGTEDAAPIQLGTAVYAHPLSMSIVEIKSSPRIYTYRQRHLSAVERVARRAVLHPVQSLQNGT